jgi:hypothetical protein
MGYDADGEGIRAILRRVGLNQHSADDLRMLREEIEELLAARRQLNQIKRIIQGLSVYE